MTLKILEKIGYRADVVGNGREAIKALESRPYDLVLMDVQMPEMGGYEATSIIRDPQSGVLNHHVPVIAMTANVMEGDREACIEAGMNDYVSKPVKPNALSDALQRNLSRDAVAVPKPADISAAHGENVLDRAALLDTLDGDEDLLNEILRIFLNDMPAQLAALREALSTEDADGARRHVHTIKGAAANVGARQMRACTAKLEEMGRTAQFAGAGELLVRLERAFEQVCQVVEGSAGT